MRECSGNFAEMTTSTSFRDLLHAANLRHGTDGFTSPPKEGVLRIFFAPKNPDGFGRVWTRELGYLRASTLPLDHRSRYVEVLKILGIMLFLFWEVESGSWLCVSVDMFNEWKREDCQKKLWSGAHQEEENEVDLNLPGRKRLEDWWEEKGLMEEDWNDRDKWKKKII